MINILNKYKIVIIAIVTFVVLLSVVKACEQEPKITIKTEVDYKAIVDSINATIIRPKAEIVYVEKKVNEKGIKTNTIVPKKTDSSIEAKTYEVKVSGLNSSSDLKITSLCEPLVITGIINCNEKTITKTITKTSAKSGLFIYASAPINNNNLNIEVGGMYQFKNTLLLLGGVQYNQFTKGLDAKIGLGIKIF